MPVMDAYLPWAEATGFRDAKGPHAAGDASDWFWLLLQLQGRTASTFCRDVRPLHRDWIRVPGHYAAPPGGLGETRCCTAIVSRSFLEVLRGAVPVPEGLQDALQSIRRFEIGHTTRPWTYTEDADTPAAAKGAQAPAAIVGVLDDGFAFANRRFCRERNGRRQTRFLSLWDQDAMADGVSPWAYGRIHSRDSLNGHIDQSMEGGFVDEDAVYLRARYAAVSRRATHGTHVLDLACGADAHHVGADAAQIVAVQLPGKALEDTSCASTTVFLLDAVRYVLRQADAACSDGQDCPVVINISLGNIAGAHDGHSIFEEALDEIIQCRGCDVVMAAGNNYLSECHAWADMPTRSTVSLQWKVRPDDGTPSYAELWFRAKSQQDADAAGPARPRGLELTVVPPNGLPAVNVGLGNVEALKIAGETLATVSLQHQVANGGEDQAMGLIALAPTICVGGWQQAAPSGTWRIEVGNDGPPVDCHVYVQRDDIAFGRPGLGRQSTLGDLYPQDYGRLDKRGALNEVDSARSYVRRVGTTNGLGTGARVHLVGAAQARQDGSLVMARYSSVDAAGRVQNLAVAEDSPVLRGVLASGTRSGSVVAMNGTSVAAPQLVRQLVAQATSGEVRQSGEASDHGGQLRGGVVPEAEDLLQRSRRRRGQ